VDCTSFPPDRPREVRSEYDKLSEGHRVSASWRLDTEQLFEQQQHCNGDSKADKVSRRARYYLAIMKLLRGVVASQEVPDATEQAVVDRLCIQARGYFRAAERLTAGLLAVNPPDNEKSNYSALEQVVHQQNRALDEREASRTAAFVAEEAAAAEAAAAREERKKRKRAEEAKEALVIEAKEAARRAARKKRKDEQRRQAAAARAARAARERERNEREAAAERARWRRAGLKGGGTALVLTGTLMVTGGILLNVDSYVTYYQRGVTPEGYEIGRNRTAGGIALAVLGGVVCVGGIIPLVVSVEERVVHMSLTPGPVTTFSAQF